MSSTGCLSSNQEDTISAEIGVLKLRLKMSWVFTFIIILSSWSAGSVPRDQPRLMHFFSFRLLKDCHAAKRPQGTKGALPFTSASLTVSPNVGTSPWRRKDRQKSPRPFRRSPARSPTRRRTKRRRQTPTTRRRMTRNRIASAGSSRRRTKNRRWLSPKFVSLLSATSRTRRTTHQLPSRHAPASPTTQKSPRSTAKTSAVVRSSDPRSRRRVKASLSLSLSSVAGRISTRSRARFRGSMSSCARSDPEASSRRRARWDAWRKSPNFTTKWLASILFYSCFDLTFYKT